MPTFCQRRYCVPQRRQWLALRDKIDSSHLSRRAERVLGGNYDRLMLIRRSLRHVFDGNLFY